MPKQPQSDIPALPEHHHNHHHDHGHCGGKCANCGCRNKPADKRQD